MYQPPCYMQIDVYSHGFKISKPMPTALAWLNEFILKFRIKGFVKETRGRFKPPVNRYFGISSYSSSVYHFHIEQLLPLLKWLMSKGITEDRYTITQHPLIEPVKVEMESTKAKKPYPQQLDAIEFITKPREESNHSRLLMMPTGTGKTYTALYCACILGMRSAIVINPSYIDKWVSDITINTDVTKEEICIIQGSDSLRSLMAKANKEEIDHIKFFVISIKTMESYFRDYEKADGVMEYISFDIAPNDLYPALGIGTVIYDEVHQMLGMVYKSITYTHTKIVIGLSATMTSLQPDVLTIQHLLFPNTIRFNDIIKKKFVECVAVGYEYENFEQLRLKSGYHGSTTYSHTAYEESLMLRVHAFKQYLELNAYILHHLFKGGNTDYKPGDKALVYSATQEMCTRLTEFFKTKYPDLDVRRYIGEDPYENIIEADICFSTLQSGGTNIDIPGLTYIHNTVSVQSAVSNLQAIGRLREIPGKNVRYSYLYCLQIPKQLTYHLEKRQLFDSETKSIKDVLIPFRINTKR